MVLPTGTTGIPRAPRRSLPPCKRRHPCLGEVRTCSTCRAVTNPLLWQCTSPSSGRVSVISWCQLTGHQKTELSSRNSFARPVLPAPLCTNTSVCLAKLFLCGVSFKPDQVLGFFLWKNNEFLCWKMGWGTRMGRYHRLPEPVTALHGLNRLWNYGTSGMIVSFLADWVTRTSQIRITTDK